ncbi:MAG: lipoyl(octanoyl) transferase [Planctomycetota bacterium]|jgi:lipoyl(octanoyl) transferase
MTEGTLLEVRRLGRSNFADALRIQEEVLSARIAGETSDVLLLTEHEPIITLGRKTPKEDLPATGVPTVEVSRGGEATYHGPGQVVAYPIRSLPEGKRDLHKYLRDLEQVVIGVLSEFDIEGHRVPDLTGVWVGEQKIASIGVAVRRWTTWHGLALNVFTDLTAFQGFSPCGLSPNVMTRMCDHSEMPPGTTLVEVLLVKHMCEVFGYDLPPPPPLKQPEPSRFPDLPIFPG